jgi:hypothetical protein
MKYSILCGHTGLHGSLLNLLDLQDHLIREGHEVDFYCLDVPRLKDNIAHTHRAYLVGNLKWLYLRCNDFRYPREERIWIKTDVVITDFKTLINLEIPIVARRTIVFDTAELSYHLEDINIDFYPEDIGDLQRIVDKHNTHMEFYMPPVNYEKFHKKYPRLFSCVYFKKINIDVLNTIKTEDNNDVFYRADAYNDFPRDEKKLPPIETVFPHVKKLEDMTDMFKYHGFIYYRRGDRAYWEQMGRLIWEFILLGKRVLLYEPLNARKDGLWDYVQHYGMVKEEIEEKMEGPWIS